jgi:hypothetical protein
VIFTFIDLFNKRPTVGRMAATLIVGLIFVTQKIVDVQKDGLRRAFMNLEKLQQLLSNGAISQDEFDYLSKGIDQPDEKDNQKEQSSEQTEENPDNQADRIEKLVQSAVDRATNRLGNENKQLREQLEKLKKEKLSDDELKALEILEKETALAEREKQILDKENRYYAIESIKKAGLDDGSTKSLDLIDFVMASDQSEIDKRVDAFKALVNSFVKAEVDKTFKTHGKTPIKSTENNTVNNPYKKETYNFTEQMKLEQNNPELAKALKMAAGVV